MHTESIDIEAILVSCFLIIYKTYLKILEKNTGIHLDIY